MVELLKKIYEQVVSTEEEAKEMGKHVAQHVDGLAKENAGQLDEDGMEALKDLMYSVALKAEQEGFQLGIQFMWKLLLELYADSVRE